MNYYLDFEFIIWLILKVDELRNTIYGSVECEDGKWCFHFSIVGGWVRRSTIYINLGIIYLYLDDWLLSSKQPQNVHWVRIGSIPHSLIFCSIWFTCLFFVWHANSDYSSHIFEWSIFSVEITTTLSLRQNKFELWSSYLLCITVYDHTMLIKL